MGSDNKKKYLRRMTAASLCAVVLCLACMVSATYALFQVSVTNEGNAFEVGRFEATNATTVYADTLGLEDPVVIPDGTVCEEGSYLLNIEWSGNVEGYIKLNVATAEENSETKVPTYVVNLPKLNETDVYRLSIPLTLHEKAVVTSESTWGTYVAAEDEDTVVLDMTNVIQFIDAGGITFGIPFETSVTIGTDVIGEDLETAVAYVPGTYYLTIDWTPGFAGYCVLDLLTAEEGSTTSPAKYIIQLPRVEETEGGENAVITIPLYLHENTRITAVTGKGTPDNAEKWQENAGISFGAQFIASAVIGQNVSDAPVKYAAISQEAYQPGVYQLGLDWSDSSADGYCVLTVTSAEEGSETANVVYVLACGQDVTSGAISLTLHEAATIKVETGKGSFTGTAQIIPAEGIVFGTEKAEEGESNGETQTETPADDQEGNQSEAPTEDQEGTQTETPTEGQDGTGTETGADGEQNQNTDSVSTLSGEPAGESAEGGQQTGEETGSGNE